MIFSVKESKMTHLKHANELEERSDDTRNKIDNTNTDYENLVLMLDVVQDESARTNYLLLHILELLTHPEE